MPSNAAKSSSVRTCLRVFCTFLSAVCMAVIIKGRKEALSWITEGRHIRVLHAGRKVQWHMAWNRAHNPCSALLLKNLSFLSDESRVWRPHSKECAAFALASLVARVACG